MVNDSHPSAWEKKAGRRIKTQDTFCYVVSGGQCGKQESLSQTNKQSKGWEGSYCVLFLQREKDSGLSSVHCLPPLHKRFGETIPVPARIHTRVDVRGRLGVPSSQDPSKGSFEKPGTSLSILNQLSLGTPTRTAGERSCLCGWRSSPQAC